MDAIHKNPECVHSDGTKFTCLEDLSIPIFGVWQESSSGNLSGCALVQEAHSHNLWGPMWDFNDAVGAARADWNPVSSLKTIDLTYEQRQIYWNSSSPNGDPSAFLDQCPKEEAQMQCKLKAESLCDIAFDQGFHKYEVNRAITTDAGIGIALMVMVGSLCYAGYNEMVHRDRVKIRLKKQMEDSLSFKQTSAKVAPEGAVPTSMSFRDRRNEEKDEKFFEMLTTESGAKRVGTIRWWDINFMEQEMEDMYRKVS